MTDLDGFFRVDGYDGIAWVAVGHPKVDVECQGHPADWDTPMGETFYCDSSCEEPTEDTDRVICIMVGDNRRFEFGMDELTEIDEEDFCAGCGQIGCGHG